MHYQHDDDSHAFLGSFTNFEGDFDLYRDGDVVIARFGDAPCENTSLPLQTASIVDEGWPLREAADRVLYPHFEHDCDKCQFLGAYESDKRYDIYQTGSGSVLARFGDDGPDYSSFPLSIARQLPEGHVLREAVDRVL